jgi:sugar-phosphatase
MRVCHGRRTEDTVAEFVRPQHLAAAVARVQALELADFDGVTALPGALQLIEVLPRQRWAAVTSGERALMTARLEAAHLPIPEVMICAEDVAVGKPSSEGYLKAAAALGFDAGHCVVIEDAPAGVAAGLAAGAHVVAVTTTHTADQVASADVIVADLSCLRVTSTDDGVLLSTIS